MGLHFGDHTPQVAAAPPPIGGELRHARLRHADDTPLEGFAWRKIPTATSGERAARGREGLAAAPVGGGGASRASRQRVSPHASTPSAAGVEGAGGSGEHGCGARGQRQGLAGLRADA